MKTKYAIALLVALGFGIANTVTAEEPEQRAWSGTFRINPAPLALALATSIPRLSLNWTGYVAERIGIPVELDLALMESGNIPGIGILGGVEFPP